MRLAHILQRQRYRLQLRFVALCQAISLEPPYYTKIEFQGHPHKWWRCGESNPGLSVFIVDCQQLIIYLYTSLLQKSTVFID